MEYKVRYYAKSWYIYMWIVHRHNESHLFILIRIASSSKHIDLSAFAEELKDLSDQGIDT